MPTFEELNRQRQGNQMAAPPPAPPPNPWQMQPQPRQRYAAGPATTPLVPPLPGDPVGQPGYTPPRTNPMVPPLPGDPVGQPGYTPPAPGGGGPGGTVNYGNDMIAPPPMGGIDPRTGFWRTPVEGGGLVGNTLNADQQRYLDQMRGGGVPGAYPGGQNNYMGYGPNAGGLRINPNYLPENWDYKQSPEYQQRLAWAQRDLNRQLLAMGRSDSTGGINAMARQQAEIAGQEIDKQYQRALQANMENYGRYFGANQANYGRTISEDERAWARAMGIDERDYARWKWGEETNWNRNWQLANLGLGATTTGVGAGAAAGRSVAEYLANNGGTQASLALARGDVSSDMIVRLLNSGFGIPEIEQIFAPRGTPQGSTLGGVPGAVQPTLPAPNVAGVGNPGQQQAALPTGQVPDWARQQYNSGPVPQNNWDI